VMTGLLAAATYALLLHDFRDPRPAWLWVATLAALVLSVAGLRPTPPDLLPHDPGEPAVEPPVLRWEWLLIGAIMLVAIVVRVWDLEHIPMGPYTDEGDRAYDARHINQGVPVNDQPFTFFGTGWWGVPNLYFWLLGRSLLLFGDNLTAARLMHALAGIATVWVVYRLGRTVWSPRVGLLAAALLAISDFAIQFSRTAGESTTTLFTWAVCFYYLYRGLQSGRLLDFVWSGIAGGLTLYGYVAGKLLPLFLAGIAVYLLLRWGRRGWWRYGPGLLAMGLAGFLTFAPNALYVLSHTAAFTERYNGVAIFTHAPQMAAEYGTDNWVLILAGQFARTFAAFDVGHEHGPFYPTGLPILPVAWAALWVLGTAYWLWRVGDVRFAVLGTWVVSGLAGAALTNDTPTLQRVAGMVPTLALVPAIYLDRLARGAVLLRRPRPWSRPVRLGRLAYGVLLVVLVGSLALQTLTFYFGPYTAAAHYYWYTPAGRYTEKLDPQRDRVYQMDTPEFYWYLGPAVFLANAVQGGDLGNVSDELPLTDNATKNAHFLVFPSNAVYLPLLHLFYPGGQESVTNTPVPPYATFFTAYAVGSDTIAARRQVTARYGPAGGPLFERQETRLGTLGPDGDQPPLQLPTAPSYPLTAEWSGGLVAPAYGNYRLELTAPAGATLELDGRDLLTVPAGSTTALESHIALAKGVHQVRLAGTLAAPDGTVALRWGTDSSSLTSVARPFLWNGPAGGWLGTAYPLGNPGFLTTPTPPDFSAAGVVRRDSVLAWRGVNSGLLGQGDARWTALLQAPQSGSYSFSTEGDSRATLWVDGQLVGGRDVPSVPPLPAAVTLTAGPHQLEVRLEVIHANALFEFYWQPPGGQRAILLPTALAVAAGGAWPAAEHPTAPAVDPALIGALAPSLGVQVQATISGGPDWLDAGALAVFPDGRVAVADVGHHRVRVYNAAGQAAGSLEATADRPFTRISDLAVASDGTLAVLDSAMGTIDLFDSSLQPQAQLTRAQTGLAECNGLTWGPDGKLYVADTSRSQVVRLSRAGAPEQGYNAAVPGHAPLEQPLDVAVTPDGTIYAVDLRGRIVRFNAGGQIDREWPVPVSAMAGSSRLALWGTTLAVTTPDGNDLNVLDLPTNQVRAVRLPGGASLGLHLPFGLATDSAGRLYVMDSGNARVLVLR
ncbi:MAG: glycosyltransferase family 39 protein, partial [Chloroflexota bacterium]|nr:glycosyltransferase family 39 protein [Chloroflexota bacterium]